nr:hypothetical protein [Tanacetum cinerariifolium]
MSDDRVFCRPCTCERCRRNYTEKFCSICCFESGNAFIDDLIANSFDDLSNFSDHTPQHQTHSFESYNDNPNYGNLPQEPFVYNQDSCYEQNFVDNSQSPPQPQYEMYSCELCGNNAHYGYDCPPQVSLVYEQEPSYNQNYNDNYYPHNSPSFLCCENCEGPHESFQCQPMNQNYFEPILSMILTILVLTSPKHTLVRYVETIITTSNTISTSLPVLPIEDPDVSLIMGNEDFNTILEKESDEFIKSSVEDLVLIPSESEDTSGSDSESILPSCDYFFPIDVLEEKVVTFSIPLFNSNDNFTSSDDESLSDEDVPKVNVKIYSNPLFEFNNEYISSDVNLLLDEVLENIKSKDSYDSNLDKPDLLVTPFFDANKHECFDSGSDDDEINVLDCEDSYYDLEGDILYLKSFLNDDLVHRDPSIHAMSVASILEGFTDKPPLEENDYLFDVEPKNDVWKRILYDAPIDDLITEDKVFDPEIHDLIFSATYVSLPFEDRHYFFFTYVVRIFLPHITYQVVSPFLISS